MVGKKYRVNKEFWVSDFVKLAFGAEVVVQHEYLIGNIELLVCGTNLTFQIDKSLLEEYFCEVKEPISKDTLYRTRVCISEKNIICNFIPTGITCKVDYFNEIEVVVRFKAGRIEIPCSFSHEEFNRYFEKVSARCVCCQCDTE